jgi:hypothetical protein
MHNCPVDNGLAVGLKGAAGLIEDAAFKGKAREPPSAETLAFYKSLEDMANDIEENGPDVEVASSRAPSPRSSPPSPPMSPARLEGPLTYWRRPYVPEEPEEPAIPWKPEKLAEPDAQEESSEEGSSSDEGISDVEDATNVDDVANVRYPMMDFGASRLSAPDEIHLSVTLNNGKTILDNVAIDLDSSIEDLFSRIEGKAKKTIQGLITRHGSKLERSDLPLKWSGLQDGDQVSALYNVHPPSRERVSSERAFQLVTESDRHDKLAAQWLDKKFTDGDNVKLGAFGDAIAAAPINPGTGPYPNTRAVGSNMPLASRIEAEGVADTGVEIADAWQGGLGLTALIKSGAVRSLGAQTLNVVPPIPPDSEAVDVAPDSGEGWDMPAGFEDAQPEAVSPQKVVSPSTQGSKVTSPPPASATLAATSPTSSTLNDLSCAPTPSRKSQASPANSRADAEDFKKKLEEKQKANDAIWANIAASLEPAPLEPTKRSFLSHTASAGSLGKKVPVSSMARTRR